MIIKQQTLLRHLRGDNLLKIYFLLGQEYFLASEAAKKIKQAFKSKNNSLEYDEIHLTINHYIGDNWQLLTQQLNNNLLFSHNQIINVLYEKKQLDTEGRSILIEFLNKTTNNNIVMIFLATNANLSQFTDFINLKAGIIKFHPLDKKQIISWIIQQLNKKSIKFTQNIPNVIQEYTEGNILACVQLLNIIYLHKEEGFLLSEDYLQNILSIQTKYEPQDVQHAMLLTDYPRLLRQLNYFKKIKQEPNLILWIISQEIRLLLQLKQIQFKHNFYEICTLLKIKANSVKCYEILVDKFNQQTLLKLINVASKIDRYIKSNIGDSIQNHFVWNSLEQLITIFCLQKGFEFFE